MKKFSTVTKPSKKEEAVDTNAPLYKGKYLSIIDAEGWEVVKENDCVIMIPHFIEFDEILLRKEDIPPYKLRNNSQQLFLTTLSGTMEEGEDELEAIIRELEEEAGVRLNTNYRGFKKWQSLFMNKGNTAQYQIFYLPLRTTDFTKVAADGDGSESEAKSATIRVDLKYVDSLKVNDTITALSLEYLRKEIGHYYKF